MTKLFVLIVGCLALLLTLTPPPPAHAQSTQRSGKMLRNDGVPFPITALSNHLNPSQRPFLAPPKPQYIVPRNLPPIRRHSPETVIGDDGRVPVEDTTAYPNSAIVYLEIDFPLGSGTCSGWMVGTHTIATAGHCVYLGALGGWATSITAYPGRNGSLVPFGSYRATHWFTKKKWPKKEKPKFDFAAINLDTNIAETVGTFGFAYNLENEFWQNYPLTVRGYPGDKPQATAWTMDGAIGQITNSRFFYDIDTAAGQSGSPAYGTWGTECDPCGFGIHNYGVGAPWTQNSATRITPPVFNFLNSVIALP